MNVKKSWKILFGWIREYEKMAKSDPETGWCHIPYVHLWWINVRSINFNEKDEEIFESLPIEIKKAALIVAEVRDRQAKLLYGEYGWTELNQRDFTSVSLTDVILKVRG